MPLQWRVQDFPWRGVNSRRGCFEIFLCQMRESGPLVGAACQSLPPGFATTCSSVINERNINCYSGGSRISRRGRGHRRGAADSRDGYVSKILYVEMKESEPLGRCALKFLD